MYWLLFAVSMTWGLMQKVSCLIYPLTLNTTLCSQGFLSLKAASGIIAPCNLHEKNLAVLTVTPTPL